MTTVLILLAVSVVINLFLVLEVSGQARIVEFFQKRCFESEKKYWAEVYSKPSLYSSMGVKP